MILEEFIYFERKELKYSQSFETRLVLTKHFLSRYPPLSKEKLKLFMDMLKDQQNEKTYKKRSTSALITFILFFLGLIAVARYSNNWKHEIEMNLVFFILMLLVILLAVATFISQKKQKPKHQLLLQVMEHLYWQQ